MTRQLDMFLDPPVRDKKCRLCKLGATVSRACLLGEPMRRRKIMVVMDAPTLEEQEADEIQPKQLLLDMLEEAGIDPDRVFFCYAVSCATDKPTKAQVKSCKSWLQKQIDFVKPKFVLLCGSVPLLALLGETGIKKHRGRPVEKDGRVFFPVFSPGYIAYDDRQKPILQQDLRTFQEYIETGGVRKEEHLNLRIVTDMLTFREMLQDLRGVVSYDCETTGLYPWAFGAEIVSIGFGTKTTQWALPLIYPDDNVKWHLPQIRKMFEQIDKALRENEVKLVMHNGKFDCLWAAVKYGMKWWQLFHADTMLMHYLLDENSEHSLKYLSKIFFNAPDYDVPLSAKTGNAPLPAHCEYLGLDVLYTRKLYFEFKRRFKADTQIANVFWHILQPCARLFTEIELNGVFIDRDKMEDAEVYLRNEIASALIELKQYESKVSKPESNKKSPFYGAINWGSPQQLGRLLFVDLGIPSIEKTDSGAESCSESVLKRVKHPIAGALLKWRAAQKQLSSFIEGWKPFLDDESRLHPSFKLHGTVTGRLSCEHPNLQQVPRDPRIRSLITAPPGYTLLEADLSQIELRIAAELANERAMLDAFKQGIDTHWLTMHRELARSGGQARLVKATASVLAQRKVTNYGEALEIVFKAGPDACAEVDPEWKEMRKKAKAINFGYLFGMWWKKFIMYARDNYDVIVTEAEAQASREGFFELYPDFNSWHESQRRFARRNGYVRTLSGRKRRLPAAMHPEKTMDRMEAERQAINSPVQSFANELNLMALLQLRNEFPRAVVRPVATVHDAILVEVRDDYIERVHNRLLEIMSWPSLLDTLEIKIKVPIEAEAKIGPWGQGKSLSKWKAMMDDTKSAKAK
jgi:uracil-DNA glycosylase family 4